MSTCVDELNVKILSLCRYTSCQNRQHAHHVTVTKLCVSDITRQLPPLAGCRAFPHHPSQGLAPALAETDPDRVSAGDPWPPAGA